jgi:hypothetical protein
MSSIGLNGQLSNFSSDVRMTKAERREIRTLYGLPITPGYAAREGISRS